MSAKAMQKILTLTVNVPPAYNQVDIRIAPTSVPMANQHNLLINQDATLRVLSDAPCDDLVTLDFEVRLPPDQEVMCEHSVAQTRSGTHFDVFVRPDGGVGQSVEIRPVASLTAPPVTMRVAFVPHACAGVDVVCDIPFLPMYWTYYVTEQGQIEDAANLLNFDALGPIDINGKTYFGWRSSGVVCAEHQLNARPRFTPAGHAPITLPIPQRAVVQRIAGQEGFETVAYVYL